MKWFKRRQDGTRRKPTRRERIAAEKTAQAEARLQETEQKIHELADQARRELRT